MTLTNYLQDLKKAKPQKSKNKKSNNITSDCATVFYVKYIFYIPQYTKEVMYIVKVSLPSCLFFVMD